MVERMTKDTTQTIHRSAANFFSGTLISRSSGAIRDMAMAFAFGTDSALAAFMVAYRFAHLARRLFGEGTLQNTFIPHFEALRHVNPDRAFAFFRDLRATLILILAVLVTLGSAILLLFYQKSEIFLYTALMLPSLFFICIYGLNAALLACQKQYFIASIAPVAFNVVWIAAALFFASLPIQTAMIGLSIAVIFACFAQMAVTWPSTRAILPAEKATPFSPDVRALIKPLMLANFGVAASQINNAIDPLFALFANAEGPAWLWYAIRIQQLPLALFGIALANALVPPISRAIKSGALEQFHQFFHFAKRRTFTVTALITAAIFATALSSINLLYGRGHFDNESITGTALCLLGYGVGLFPMAYVLIAGPALFALGDYKNPSKGAVIAMLINISLNSLFVFGFHWNSASVALATSLAAFWNAHFLSEALNAKTGYVKDPKWLPSLAKVGVISIGALLATWLIESQTFGYAPTLQLLMGNPLTLPDQFVHQLGFFLAEASIFCSIAGAALYSLKVEI